MKNNQNKNESIVPHLGSRPTNKKHEFRCNKCEYVFTVKEKELERFPNYGRHGIEGYTLYVRCENCGVLLKKEIKL